MGKYSYRLDSEPQWKSEECFQARAVDCDGNDVLIEVLKCSLQLHKNDVIESETEQDVDGRKQMTIRGRKLTKYEYKLIAEPQKETRCDLFASAEDCDGKIVTLVIRNCKQQLKSGDIIRSDGEHCLYGCVIMKFKEIV